MYCPLLHLDKNAAEKKNFIRLQDYNKRRRLFFEEKETNENNTNSIESEDEEIVEEEKTRIYLLVALI